MTAPRSNVVYYPFDRYNADEKQNTASLVALIVILLRPYLPLELKPRDWYQILRNIFPTVQRYRRQSSANARAFYDSERAQFIRRQRNTVPILGRDVMDLDLLGDLQDLRDSEIPDVLIDDDIDFDNEPERHPIFLAEYEEPWLREALEPVRDDFLPETADQKDLEKVVHRVVKEVKNGGRQTQVRATRSDQLVQGWARVEGGGESCAFCTMLISRGPVYLEANTAGFGAPNNVAAIRIWERFERTGDDTALMALMNRYHANCDCRVVPVFDRQDWPGRDAYLEAEQLWKESTKGYAGRDALNALRRSMGDGYKQGSLPAAA